MIDNTYTEFVFAALRITPVIAVVAIASFARRNRLMFLLGLVGCFFGLFVDRGGSTGGFIEHATTRADSFQFLGIVGATIGCTIALAIPKIAKRNRETPDVIVRGDAELPNVS